MAPSLVAAYASDSDSDESQLAAPATQAPPAASESDARASPEPEPSRAPPRASGLALPPPKAGTSAAKRRIHVELEPAPTDADKIDVPKRPRMERSEGAHGLLGMLPAPKSNKSIVKPPTDEQRPENAVDDDARIALVDTQDKDDAKDNDDFRAMLGLAPKAPQPERSKPKVIETASPAAPATTTIPKDTPSMSATVPSTDTQSSSSSSAKFRVSAAPDVGTSSTERDSGPEPEVDLAALYPGWRQDPDGSWYPVTPEAHAAYAAWAAQAEAEAQAQAAFRSKSDVVPDASQLTTFDAAAELRNAPPSQSAPPANKKPKVEWNISEKLQSERLTNMRARNRGQLSALLMHAVETRDALEDRWSQGKAKRREASKRYGF
ncbi:hypothetical protein MBRA1_001057 [Malassezia brasiliensis]|uniref:Mitotic checkpoint regulator, MAD2B-interacting-domain-containing protein n=1 Tax=Malassezia brasiliensis TaxID=1821822 RepID=A0AAF0IN02_9BASI|nr:hypothetical protein MBRA1_001057 [Malassezia brasiliensis]